MKAVPLLLRHGSLSPRGSRSSGVLAAALATMLVAGQLAGAAEVVVRTSVDKSKVTVGDRLKYTVTIEADPKLKVIPPDIGLNLGQFEIKDYHVAYPEVEGKKVTQVQYEIATFETGTQEIPPVTVTYLEHGQRKEVRSEKLTITVESLAPSKEKEPKDIKPPVEVAPNWSGFRLVAAIAAGVLALVLLLAWYLRKRRRAGESTEWTEPPRPAHLLAFDELQALRDSALLAEGHYKEYFSGVADALRRYLEGRFRIRAMDETTGEIIAQLETGLLPPDRVEGLRALLQQCDLVKFAKFVPADPESEGRQTLEQVWQFVEETKAAAEDEVEGDNEGQRDEEDPKQTDPSDLSDAADLSEPFGTAAEAPEPGTQPPAPGGAAP